MNKAEQNVINGLAMFLRKPLGRPQQLTDLMRGKGVRFRASSGPFTAPIRPFYPCNHAKYPCFRGFPRHSAQINNNLAIFECKSIQKLRARVVGTAYHPPSEAPRYPHRPLCIFMHQCSSSTGIGASVGWSSKDVSSAVMMLATSTTSASTSSHAARSRVIACMSTRARRSTSILDRISAYFKG